MAANGLIDTGAILALLDRSDRWHQPCLEALRQVRLPLLTSEAVLTELFHLIGETHTYRQAAWKFIRSGAVVLGAIEQSELPLIQELMTRYADRPMDFADATLVHLAERESLSTVFTIDFADFQTYRFKTRSRFRILPFRTPS